MTCLWFYYLIGRMQEYSYKVFPLSRNDPRSHSQYVTVFSIHAEYSYVIRYLDYIPSGYCRYFF
jgi:hypothetical protein